ncbi:DotG/IcmE/VirB10 family protein (plasmid) [Achromobacter seleniivolatilans]|uniref:DotG/IcmE/VirB10 family protein n=1 Tax=Achromobacter seleniivolatilans TaxID=3047478 RepID=A0ABY9MAE8_9BURK|nr:DotG/IcmE/VirB10 family protein [Achromobacter sp. R39]WMD23924.1 DotG/IcmE/VirB10 family protein [Achromobacter sp. R39]
MTTKKRADGTDKPETSQTRPTARGFKRNLVLVGVMLFVCVFIALGLAWWAGSGGKKGSEPTSSLGPINPNGTGEVRRELSPAMQEKQNRVFQDEAEAARKQGRTYIPNEGTLGLSTPVEPPQASAAAEGGLPTTRRMSGGSGAQASQDNVGLTRQIERITRGMDIRAEKVQVLAKDDSAARTQAGASMALAAASPASKAVDPSASRGRDLTNGQEIHPAELLSPIDTDKTDEATARITGGPLAGATFVGKLVVFEEDFAMGFTSMRFDGKFYAVQAVGVNEQTASRAMGADVDHRFFDRFVMPVLSSGLWGAATYFTERGRTATQYVPTGIGGDIVVSDERASREDAKNSGIGAGISKAQQVAEAEVQRRAAKKNRMTLPQFTPLGIRFEQPVYAKDAK